MNLENQIDVIVNTRKNNLPIVKKTKRELKSRISSVKDLNKRISELIKFKSKIDETMFDYIVGYQNDLKVILEKYENAALLLNQLESRFSRDTINIGVSGEARVGKSTTLQKFSGLDDRQIPTGKGLPVTAVRSEIFNENSEYAEITFRNTEEFINEYINPHLENVNGALFNLDENFEPLTISSLNDLKSLKIPDTLGESVDTKTSNSKNILEDAKNSFSSFSSLLTGETIKIAIDDIRSYVAYPSNDEIKKDKHVARKYFAVKQVKIYSNFPSLSHEKIGLIDLPGLGEIGNNAAKIHTSGLEDSVDQVLMIMRPTEAEGYVKSGIGQNVDQLREIQKGIKKRSDLIVAAINRDNTNIDSTKTLRDHFEKQINSSQSDKIQIVDFCAINADSVSEMFINLLQKLAKSLPQMDKDAYDYVMKNNIFDVDEEYKSLKNNIYKLIADIVKLIPLEENILDEICDQTSRMIIAGYNDLEESKYAIHTKDSPLRKDLEDRVRQIRDSNSELIKSGLFMKNTSTWKSHAKGRHDYINFARDESKRIKAELIDSYRKIDTFYDNAINALKKEVIELFFSQTGNFRNLVCEEDDVDLFDNKLINKLIRELDSATRNEDFSHCFKFLTEIRFKFSQNVFYNIYDSLSELQNPDLPKKLGEYGLSADEKIELVQKNLIDLSLSGNDAISDSILSYNDNFNKFLFTCMTFFNDFLYRKDERRFERNIRILIKERRDFLIPDYKFEGDRDMMNVVAGIRNCCSDEFHHTEQNPVYNNFSYRPSELNKDYKTFDDKAKTKSPTSNVKKPVIQPGKSKTSKKSQYEGSYNQEWGR